jgi:hypothetical protein
MAPNDACRAEFEYRRRKAIASGGTVVNEQMKLDGRTLVLTFANGERRGVVMPTAREIIDPTGGNSFS